MKLLIFSLYGDFSYQVAWIEQKDEIQKTIYPAHKTHPIVLLQISPNPKPIDPMYRWVLLHIRRLSSYDKHYVHAQNMAWCLEIFLQFSLKFSIYCWKNGIAFFVLICHHSQEIILYTYTHATQNEKNNFIMPTVPLQKLFYYCSISFKEDLWWITCFWGVWDLHLPLTQHWNLIYKKHRWFFRNMMNHSTEILLLLLLYGPYLKLQCPP